MKPAKGRTRQINKSVFQNTPRVLMQAFTRFKKGLPDSVAEGPPSAQLLKDQAIPIVSIVMVLFVAITFFSHQNKAQKQKIEQNKKDYQAAASSYSKGEFKPAIEKLENVAANNPQDANNQQLLGRSYEATGKLDEAEKAHLASLKANPNQPEVIYNLAIIHKSQGKTKEAIDN